MHFVPFLTAVSIISSMKTGYFKLLDIKSLEEEEEEEAKESPEFVVVLYV